MAEYYVVFIIIIIIIISYRKPELPVFWYDRTF
jgi:hypothetical protein